MSIKATPTFSLKDEIFNESKVKGIAKEIKAVYPNFAERKFAKQVTDKFPELELMERLHWMRDCLHEFLPVNYKEAVSILLASLPEPSDPCLEDNDFGDFIYGPFGAFVAEYGIEKRNLAFSLDALKEMTKRFSVEFPIRTFINIYPEETLNELEKWAQDKNYHVRRLASEGTRPYLPWAKKINLDQREVLPILEILYKDKTRYVTRSVANHLNDISKTYPTLVVRTLKKWQKAKQQDVKELDFIIKHSLRTLEKRGNKEALALLGFAGREIEIVDFKVNTKKVNIGETLDFTFAVRSTSKKQQKLLLDYHLYFKKANGQLAAKTFKISKTTIKPGELINIEKSHRLRPMTSKTLYPGRHALELQINGIISPRKDFELTNL